MVIRGLSGTDFDSDMADYLVSKDSFAVTASYPSAPATSSSGWGNFFSDLGKSILGGAAKGATGLITSRAAGSTSPTELAAAQAAAAARASAERNKMLLLVGGVGAVVVLGALVLRRRRR